MSSRMLAEIVEKWESREQQIRQLEISWKETFLTTAEMQVSIGKEPQVAGSDAIHELDHHLMLAGNNLRYERNGPRWDAELARFSDREHKTVLNEGLAKIFDRNDPMRELDFSSGIIRTDTFDFSEMSVFPAMVFARPKFITAFETLEGTFPSQGNTKIDVETTMLDGREIRRIVIGFHLLADAKRGQSDRRTFIYDLDETNYLPLKLEILDGHVTIWRVAWKYGNLEGELIPLSWSAQSFSRAGKLMTSIDSRTVKYRLNKEIPATMFEYDFPVDTFVTDYSQPELHTYIQLQNGQKRILGPTESLEELIVK